MQSKASTVRKYLAGLSPDRRAAISAVRDVILRNLDPDIEEGMQYGMIGYAVPHRVYPAGYHCNPEHPLPFAGLASQKHYMSIYLMSVYADPAEEKWLRDRWKAAGKKLEDVPLDVLGEAIARVSAKRHIAFYEAARRDSGASAPRKRTTT